MGWGSFVGGIKDGIDKIGDVAEDAVDTVVDGVNDGVDAVEDVFDDGVEAVEDGVDAAGDWVDGAVDDTEEFFEDVGDAITDPSVLFPVLSTISSMFGLPLNMLMSMFGLDPAAYGMSGAGGYSGASYEDTVESHNRATEMYFAENADYYAQYGLYFDPTTGGLSNSPSYGSGYGTGTGTPAYDADANS